MATTSNGTSETTERDWSGFDPFADGVSLEELRAFNDFEDKRIAAAEHRLAQAEARAVAEEAASTAREAATYAEFMRIKTLSPEQRAAERDKAALLRHRQEQTAAAEFAQYEAEQATNKALFRLMADHHVKDVSELFGNTSTPQGRKVALLLNGPEYRRARALGVAAGVARDLTTIEGYRAGASL